MPFASRTSPFASLHPIRKPQADPHSDRPPAEEIAEDGIDDETGQEISATKSDQYKDLPTAAPHESKQHQQGTKSAEVNGKL